MFMFVWHGMAWQAIIYDRIPSLVLKNENLNHSPYSEIFIASNRL